jgi:hypothetical protein
MLRTVPPRSDQGGVAGVSEGTAELEAGAVAVTDRGWQRDREFTANWAASNKALELYGKELGMFRETDERAEKGGLFDGWNPDDVKALRDELAKRLGERGTGPTARAPSRRNASR